MKVFMGKYPGLRSKKERNISIRIDKYDTWSMDYTLAKLIHPMLVQLQATKHGAPGTEDADVPENLRATVSSPDKDSGLDANWFKRWDWILDEMIWAFNEIANDNPGEPDVKEWTEEGQRPYVAYYNRIANGTRLFGVYFSALWD